MATFLKYAVTEVKICFIMRSILTQINFSKSSGDPEEHVKAVGEFNQNSILGETFATWYDRYRIIYLQQYVKLIERSSNSHPT